MNLLILQKNSNKGGAQHALSRILKVLKTKKEFNIYIICSSKGWFTHQLDELDIKYFLIKFPSYKSFFGKIFKLKKWSTNIYTLLKREKFTPNIIIANNYIESIYSLKLSNLFNDCTTITFFRDSYMSKKDYHYFKCENIDLKICISDYMQKKLLYCNNTKVVTDGLLSKEFYPLKEKSPTFPKKVLLLGGPHTEKGWNTFFEAIDNILRKHNIKLFDSIITTGIPSQQQKNKLKLNNSIEVIFHQKFENLLEEVRKYDLVVFPSKKESFGLAALEVIAAGIPLLSSKTGIIHEVINEECLLFSPGNVRELEDKLIYLYKNWAQIEFNLITQQRRIKEKYLVEHQIEKLIKLLKGNIKN